MGEIQQGKAHKDGDYALAWQNEHSHTRDEKNETKEIFEYKKDPSGNGMDLPWSEFASGEIVWRHEGYEYGNSYQGCQEEDS